MRKIKIKGVEVRITQQQQKHMKYFQESNSQVQVNFFQVQSFYKMIQIMEHANYCFPEFPAIKTKNLNQVVGDHLANYLKKFKINQLSELHAISNFFNCYGVRKLITAAAACHFYFTPNKFKQKLQQLGIKQYPTIESIKKNTARIPL